MNRVGCEVRCTKGNIIKLHDVCRSFSTQEILIVAEAVTAASR